MDHCANTRVAPPRGDPWNCLDGPVHDFLNGHEDDGRPLPAVLWEAMREGWDDYRYLYTSSGRSMHRGAPGGPAFRRP